MRRGGEFSEQGRKSHCVSGVTGGFWGYKWIGGWVCPLGSPSELLPEQGSKELESHRILWERVMWPEGRKLQENWLIGKVPRGFVVTLWAQVTLRGRSCVFAHLSFLHFGFVSVVTNTGGNKCVQTWKYHPLSEGLALCLIPEALKVELEETRCSRSSKVEQMFAAYGCLSQSLSHSYTTNLLLPAHGIEWKKKFWTTPGFKVEVVYLIPYSYKTNFQEALMLWTASALSWVSFGEKSNQVLPSCPDVSQCKERKITKIMEV